jgi:RNA 2',3'-cyclic 3'-phosphodiesterase
MEKRHRIFIAINLPVEIKKELAKYQEKWPELPAKWTPKDNLHITLEFLGNLTDQETGDVCQIVAEISKRHKSFTINLTKVLYGPPDKNPPKMIWVAGEKSEELTDLKNDLEECVLEKVKFRPDEKGFSLHITLARILEWEFRKIEPEEVPEISENIDLNFSADSIEVMESEMKRGGPQYTILESHQLEV